MSVDHTEPVTRRAAAEPSRFYVPALDGMRFVAFFLVLLHHLPDAGLSPVFSRIQGFGWVGVDLFFVISSYLFFRLLSIERERNGRIEVVRFYIRRALRIWPTYYAFVIVMFAVALMTGGGARESARFIGLLLFSDNLLMWFDGFNPIRSSAHLWTLSFEEQVYLAIPALFAAAWALGARRATYACAAIIVAATALRLAVLLVRTDAHVVIWSNPVLRPESIVLGALLGLGVGRRWLESVPALGKLAAGMAVLALGVAAPALQLPGWQQLYLYPLTAVGATLLVAGALDPSPLTRLLLEGRAVVFLGRISYGLYLYHLVAIALARRALALLGPWAAVEGTAQWLALAALSLLVVTGIAALSYSIVERPILRLKERFAVVQSRPA